MKREKILLIAPDPGKFGHRNHIIRIAKTLFPPLGLMMVGGLTPPDFNVQLIDEAVADLSYDVEADLVALSTNTTSAMRASEIAGEMRRRGKTVVMGGIHASALPEEALKYVDCVIVGEAEMLWPRMLDDWRAGKLAPIYQTEEFADLTNLPWPRRGLISPRSYYLPNTIQTSRGCPYGCTFCSVTRFFGGKYRMRRIEDVIEEITWLKSWSRSPIIFVDDNIFADVRRAKELMTALIPLKIEWFGQASMNTLQNDDFLSLASESGCRVLFVGFESLSEANLKDVHKQWNKPAIMKETIARLNRHQIVTLGAFIVGFAEDDLTVVQRIVDFAQESHLPLVQTAILIPLPGTPEAKRLESTIFDHDYRHYDGSRLVFFHPHITPPKALEEALQNGYREIYSKRAVRERLKDFSGPPLKIAQKAIRGYQLRMNKWLKKLSILGLRG